MAPSIPPPAPSLPILPEATRWFEAAPLGQGWLPCLPLCSSTQRSLISCTEARFFTSLFIHRVYMTEEKGLKNRCWLPKRHTATHPLLFPSRGQQGQGRGCPPSAWPALNPPFLQAWEGKTKAQRRKQMAPGLRHPASAYLPRAEGDEPGVLAKGALLYLTHKLGQLGVGPTAVVNLLQGKAGDFKGTTASLGTLCTSRNAMA